MQRIDLAIRVGVNLSWLRYLAIGSGILVFALLCAAVVSEDGISRHERLSEELRRIRLINQDFQQDNHKLREEAEALRSDSQYVESVIRDELGWVRADEIVVIVPPDSPIESP